MSDLSLLPEGWAIETIGNLILSSNTGLVRGVNDQSSDKEFSYFKMNNLSTKGKFELTNLVKVDATNEELLKYSLQAGDFIFNTRNSVELVGKCGVLEHEPSEPVIFNNNLLRITFRHINPRIISFWFNSADGKSQLRSVISATTSVAAIYQKALIALEVPIPPLAEQKVITDKLDELLAQVESTKARLDAIPAILKSFRQSVLAAAVSGKLTKEWREDLSCYLQESIEPNKLKFKPELFENAQASLPVLPPEWKVLPSAYLLEYVTSGSRGWASYYSNDGALFLRMSNVRYDTTKLDLNDLQHVQLPETVEGKRSLVQIDDLIISITADVGRVARIEMDLGEAYINQHLALARPINNINSEYFAMCIAAQNIGVKQIQELKRGATKAGLGLDDIRSLALPVPSLDEQAEIVRRVEELFAFADKVEAQVNAAQARVNNLTQSILAKAFRGELTADWRTANPELISGDNSASALLKRIKVERETLSVKKKPAKKAKA